MTALTKKAYITPEEYLVMEAVSPVKHEYFDGEVFQMAGASFAHNQLSMNISGTLFGKLDRNKCSVVQNDMRLYVQSSGLFTYPDVMVICGKPDISTIRGLENLVNPVLIFEILSPSTEAYDKGVKFDHYRSVASLAEYVLVWQDKKRVARYSKQNDQNWLLTDFIGEDGDIQLTSIGCSLLMEDIYDKVNIES